MATRIVILIACLLAAVSAPAQSQEQGPREIASEADLEDAIRNLNEPETRMQALESLIEFARFKLYEGSVAVVSRDADMNALRKRAARAVHSCADIETVTKALDHPSRRLRYWGVMSFRVFSPLEKPDPAWLALLPRLKRIAEGPDASLRWVAVMRLGSYYEEAKGFLAERVELETSALVLMRLVRKTTSLRGYRARFRDILYRRLSYDEDEHVRIDALNFIGRNRNRAEMWQFQLDRAMYDRVIELTRSKSPSERSAAAYTLEEAKALDPARSRDAFLWLARDPSPQVRWRAAHSLAGELRREDVRRVMDALLKDESPLVRFFAVLADGERKHIDELKTLAQCEDKQIADMAARRVARLVKEDTAAQEKQGGQREGVGNREGKTGADSRGR